MSRTDFWLLFFTFVVTLTGGIQVGILSGVGASLVLFLVRTTRPHFAVMGQIPGTEAYLNVARHPHAQTRPGILVLRIDAQLYFGNVSFLKQTLRELEARASHRLRAVVLDAGGINQLDSSAEEALCEIDADYRQRGIDLYFSHVKGPVRDVMYRSGLLERLAHGRRIFLRTHDAVRAAGGETVRASLPPGPTDPRNPPDRIGCGSAPGAADEPNQTAAVGSAAVPVRGIMGVMKERRQNVRVHPVADYDIAVDYGEGIVREKLAVIDAAVGGVGLQLVESLASLPALSNLKLGVTLPNVPRFVTTATIRYTQGKIGGRCGVHFANLTEDQQQALSRAVSELLERGHSA